MSRAQSNLGHHREAIAIAERARATLPPEASAMQRAEMSSRLGEALFLAGQAEASIPPLEEALRLTVAEVGRRNSQTTRALMALGRAEGHLGQIEKAEAHIQETIAFDSERYGPDRVAYPFAYLGEARLYAGRFREAAAAFDSAISMGSTEPPAQPPRPGRVVRAASGGAHGLRRVQRRRARRASGPRHRGGERRRGCSRARDAAAHRGPGRALASGARGRPRPRGRVRGASGGTPHGRKIGADALMQPPTPEADA